MSTDRFKPNSHAWWTRTVPNGQIRARWPVLSSMVRVIAIAEGYAMVRSGGGPFVVSLNELEFIRERTALAKQPAHGIEGGEHG
jgi:hypothetical protein